MLSDLGGSLISDTVARTVEVLEPLTPRECTIWLLWDGGLYLSVAVSRCGTVAVGRLL